VPPAGRHCSVRGTPAQGTKLLHALAHRLFDRSPPPTTRSPSKTPRLARRYCTCGHRTALLRAGSSSRCRVAARRHVCRGFSIALRTGSGASASDGTPMYTPSRRRRNSPQPALVTAYGAPVGSRDRCDHVERFLRRRVPSTRGLSHCEMVNAPHVRPTGAHPR